MAENEKKPLMKKRDVLIVGIVLLVAVAGMLAVKYLTPNTATNYAKIYVGSYVYKEIPLNENQVIEINQGRDIVNHVEVKDGAIFMADSSCPDQQCVYQGEISMENYEQRALRNWVVCLPNQVTVELVLEDEG